MDKQWEKSDLISYLYGEINQQEKEELEKAVAQDPNLKKELDELKEAKEIMGALSDKEVIVPELGFGESGNTIFRRFPLRTMLAVAASITLLFIIGYATGLSLRISKGEVALTWNKNIDDQERLLTREEMDQVINDKIQELQSRTDQNLDKKLNGISQEMDAKFATLQQNNKKEITRLVNQKTQDYQEELSVITAGLREQNLKAIADFIEVANQEQKDDVKKMLVDFGSYLDQQRREDLVAIDQNIKSLRENSDSKFQETGAILASIINTVNTRND